MIIPRNSSNFAERLLRNRGRLRAVATAVIEWDTRRKLSLLKKERWSPECPVAISNVPISMTSWSKRFNTLHYTLMSLIQQRVRPREIILWISSKEHHLLPTDLEPVFRPYGLRVRLCDDLKSHKKWLPMIESCETGPFVICDDDILYPSDWFESLIKEDRDDAYVGTKCHRIVWEPDGHPAAYAKWDKQISWSGFADASTFITGCGGAIIYPNRIGNWFRDRSNIVANCPGADDVWLKAAHMAAGLPCFKTRYCFPCLEISGSTESGLALENVRNGLNDEQIQNVREYFAFRI